MTFALATDYTQTMLFEFNNEEILKILNDFSNSTNLIASFHFDCSVMGNPKSYNVGYNSNPNRYDANDSENFCRFLHNSGLRPLCEDNDANMMHSVKKDGKSLIYSCHAGLCEAITPVVFENITIGYIMCGKFIDAEHRYSTLKKVKDFSAKHNLDYKKLYSLYKKTPVITMRQFKSAMNLLKVCILYIIEKKFISIKELTVVEQVKDHIENNITSDLKINDLCKLFYINRQKLCTTFKQRFDVSIKQFIIEKKLDKAKELLISSDKSVSDVSYEAGFSDYNYFIRVFSRRNGISPLKFRRQNALTDH